MCAVLSFSGAGGANIVVLTCSIRVLLAALNQG